MDKKKALISIAIALVFVFFVGYGIEVFDPSPEYEEFCPSRLYEITNQTACEQQGGIWNEGEDLQPKPVRGMCQPSRECHEQFAQARSQHDKIVFIVAIIIGLAAVITGVILQKEAVGTGIVAGGVLTILYGTIRYWQYAQDILKFVLLGIALAILIWLGYKKLDKK